MLTARIVLFILSLVFIVVNTDPVNASYNPQTGKCIDDGVDTITYASVCDENGASGTNNPAQCITSGPDIWTFNYTVCRVSFKENPFVPGDCSFNYAYETANCNSADRCEGASTGATGYAANGHVYTGHCRESSFDGINPATACPTGAYYKQCCSSPGAIEPETYCQNGICPAGQITSSGITSCNIPVTCSKSTSVSPNPYTQCGQICNGVTYPPNDTVSVTVDQCTDGTTQYDCTDLGPQAGQCGNPGPGGGGTPSCSVTWTLSNSNPQTNTTITANVTNPSVSNMSWTSPAYTIDSSGWINSSAPPTTFSINSGSTVGPHTLQFSALDNLGNRVICSGSTTFVTQAPSQNNAATCTVYTVNNGAPVAAGQTIPIAITMNNAGTSTWVNTGPTPYRLGAQQPQDSPNWGTTALTDSGQGSRPTRLDVSSSITPSNNASFNFNVVAPTSPNTYRLSFQMVEESVEWFGGLCQKDITVQPPSFIPSCTGVVTNPTTRTVQWNATPNTAGYTYVWSGDASGTGQSVTQTYATAGLKSATVTITSNLGVSQSANCSVTIPPPAPTMDLKVTPAGGSASNGPITVDNNSTVSLSWTTTNTPTSCTASGDWSGTKTASGDSQSVGPLAGGALGTTYNYTLSCSNSSGSAPPDTVTVNVRSPSGTAPSTPPPPGAFNQLINSPNAGCTGTSPFVDLNWSNSVNADTYEVYRDGSLLIASLIQSSYRDVNVSTSSIYGYLIRAVNTGGSIYSDNGTAKFATTSTCGTGAGGGGGGVGGGGGGGGVGGGGGGGSTTTPWIQTSGGDVHANELIDTETGP